MSPDHSDALLTELLLEASVALTIAGTPRTTKVKSIKRGEFSLSATASLTISVLLDGSWRKGGG